MSKVSKEIKEIDPDDLHEESCPKCSFKYQKIIRDYRGQVNYVECLRTTCDHQWEPRKFFRRNRGGKPFY